MKLFYLFDSEVTEMTFTLIFLTVSDNYVENNEEDSVHEFARIFGTEHPWFWRIHITALVTLGEIEAGDFKTVLVLLAKSTAGYGYTRSRSSAPFYQGHPH